MTAEILDFYDKKLEEDAVLKVFKVNTGKKLFQTNLGKNLFRRVGPDMMIFNRDISVQYEYTDSKTAEIEAYIYLGELPVIAFPRCDAQKGTNINFRMSKEQILIENPSLSKEPFFTVREKILGGILALLVLGLIIVTLYTNVG